MSEAQNDIVLSPSAVSRAQQQLLASGVCLSPPSHSGALLILALWALVSFDSLCIPPPSLATRLWISEAMVRKALSTLSELLALVSRKGTLRDEARSCRGQRGRGKGRDQGGGRSPRARSVNNHRSINMLNHHSGKSTSLSNAVVQPFKIMNSNICTCVNSGYCGNESPQSLTLLMI